MRPSGRIADQRGANASCDLGLAFLQAELGHVVVHVGVGSLTGWFDFRQLMLGVGDRFFGRKKRFVSQVFGTFQRSNGVVGPIALKIRMAIGGSEGRFGSRCGRSGFRRRLSRNNYSLRDGGSSRSSAQENHAQGEVKASSHGYLYGSDEPRSSLDVGLRGETFPAL
jgi:hypothetical protein